MTTKETRISSVGKRTYGKHGVSMQAVSHVLSLCQGKHNIATAVFVSSVMFYEVESELVMSNYYM